jgi:hypothetical protein
MKEREITVEKVILLAILKHLDYKFRFSKFIIGINKPVFSPEMLK